MDNTKLVTVVVATYRRNAELRRAISSLKNQTCSDFEIVLVDDNDDKNWNDRVIEIADSSGLQINLIHNHPGLGSAGARNVGIRAAKGKYVTFLDDDDEYLPDKIKNQVTYMENKGLDYSITDIDLFYDNGKLAEHRKRYYLRDDMDKNELLRCHFMYHLTGTDTLMFRRDYLLKIGCFSGIDFGDEFYLMQKAIENEGKFGYLKGCDLKAYIHEGENGISSGESKIRGENEIYAYKKKYFPSFNRKTVRYIKMRHYAVLAFAELRIKNYCAVFKNCLKAFFLSPIGCLNMLLDRQK